MSLDKFLSDDDRTVFVLRGGRSVHLTLRCPQFRGKTANEYYSMTVLEVKSKVKKPHICSRCLKRISSRG